MDAFTIFLRRIIGAFAVHYTYLAVIFSVFIFLGFTDQLPLPANLNRWDVGWYYSITENGYQFLEGQQSNVAFFPLFPYLWKLSHVGLRGISLINTALFLLAFIFLAREFKMEVKHVLLFLSIPSLIFMYVPYTEATFFLFSSLLLIGLHRRSTPMIIAGIFLCCITRSATLLFFPAIMFMEWMDSSQGKSAIQKLKNITLYLTTAILGLFVVAFIQWIQTDKWFTFFGVHKFWNQFLQIPDFPLTTWGGYLLIWLDGPALWVGLAASVFCMYLLYRWLTGNPIQLPFNNLPLLFSAGYLVGAMMFVMLFQGGHVILNRYIFATPYFFLFFFYFLQCRPLKIGEVILILILTILVWISFGAHTRLDGMSHLKTAWYFIVITLYLMANLLINNSRLGHYALAGVYSLNIILQLALFNIFLSGNWVG